MIILWTTGEDVYVCAPETMSVEDVKRKFREDGGEQVFSWLPAASPLGKDGSPKICSSYMGNIHFYLGKKSELLAETLKS